MINVGTPLLTLYSPLPAGPDVPPSRLLDDAHHLGDAPAGGDDGGGAIHGHQARILLLQEHHRLQDQVGTQQTRIRHAYYIISGEMPSF